jgi:predicted secreted protein
VATRVHLDIEPSAQLTLLQRRLRDERSMKVAFVSHCLINQNVRYLGGATSPACMDPVVDRLRAGDVGIVQMPCPEQRAWGGVLKRRMLHLYGTRWSRSRIGRPLTLAVTRQWTRLQYRRLARRVAREMRDYIDSGYEVTEIIGVGPSPSCGVTATVDLAGAIDAMARCDPGTIDADTVNTAVVRANTIAGRGLFMEALVSHLDAEGLRIPVREQTLVPASHCARTTARDAARRSFTP